LAVTLLHFMPPAVAERADPSSSFLLEGAQLVEDLLGAPQATRGRAGLASVAKAGVVAILAALAGRAGFGETRPQGTDGASGPDTAVELHDVPADTEEADACDPPGACAAASQSAVPGDDREEDELHGEYTGFMDGMYEDVFDDLSASDLVSGGPAAIAAANLVGVGAGDLTQSVADSGDRFDGSLELEQLETMQARECAEFEGDDYSDMMEHEYQGLRSEMEANGALLKR